MNRCGGEGTAFFPYITMILWPVVITVFMAHGHIFSGNYVNGFGAWLTWAVLAGVGNGLQCLIAKSMGLMD